MDRPSVLTTQRSEQPDRPDHVEQGVEANARLTGSLAAVLLVLLFLEGITVLRIGSLLRPHIFIGMLLIPPVLLKVASTTYRFARYYLGSPAYRRKGPPPTLLRLLGPALVLLTALLLGSGVALLFVGHSPRSTLLFIHKASFVLWFGVMTVHVVAHVLDTARLAPRDWYWRTRDQVRGATLRQWGIAASLLVGVVLGIAFVGRASHFVLG